MKYVVIKWSRLPFHIVYLIMAKKKVMMFKTSYGEK